MPRLNHVADVPIQWNPNANRYFSANEGPFAQLFDRLRPVLDPIVVTVGPNGRPGGKHPWEGNDPRTGRRYVARKQRDRDLVSLEEVVD